MIEIDNDRKFDPPDYEINSVFKCYYCDCGIFEDDYYYKISGEKYCEDCLNDNFRKIAEKLEFGDDS